MQSVRERVSAREYAREREQQLPGNQERELRKDVEQNDTTGWQEVRRRKISIQRKTDVAKSLKYFARDAPRTTYFFTNFKENFRAKHMLKAFSYYGDCEEVVIPPKKDKLGKRFGFVRIVNIKEPDRFVVKLDNIIIGREKIMVNLPRFHRKPSDHHNHSLPKHKPNVPPIHNSVTQQTMALQPKTATNNYPLIQSEPQVHAVNKQKTWPSIQIPKANHQMVWMPKQNQKPKPKPDLPNIPETIVNHNQNINYKPPQKPRRAWAHRYFTTDEEEIKKLSTTYVGVVRKAGMSYNIQEEFIQEGYFSVREIDLGTVLWNTSTCLEQ